MRIIPQIMKILIFISITILFIISCEKNDTLDNNNNNGKYETNVTEHDTIIYAGQKVLNIENSNGLIGISTHNTDQNLHLVIEKKVKSDVSLIDAENHLNDIIITKTVDESMIKLEVDHPDNSNDIQYEIDIFMPVPDSMEHNLALGNGAITMDCKTNNAEVGLGNGEIEAELDLYDICMVKMALGNGAINLAIPSTINSSLKATVGNGIVSSSGLTLQNSQITSTNINGTIGSGIGSIELVVGNGEISIVGK